jgi:cation transport protein ChaC
VTRIFGYGSMLWKPPVPEAAIKSKYPATINGFYRRFWMKSSDHRGTVARPGFVVTLIKNDHKDVKDLPEETTLGMVYEIELTEELLKDLDFRERHGYMRTLE